MHFSLNFNHKQILQLKKTKKVRYSTNWIELETLPIHNQVNRDKILKAYDGTQPDSSQE